MQLVTLLTDGSREADQHRNGICRHPAEQDCVAVVSHREEQARGARETHQGQVVRGSRSRAGEDIDKLQLTHGGQQPSRNKSWTAPAVTIWSKPRSSALAPTTSSRSRVPRTAPGPARPTLSCCPSSAGLDTGDRSIHALPRRVRRGHPIRTWTTPASDRSGPPRRSPGASLPGWTWCGTPPPVQAANLGSRSAVSDWTLSIKSSRPGRDALSSSVRSPSRRSG